MADSTIEWTTKTWNYTTGCNKIVTTSELRELN